MFSRNQYIEISDKFFDFVQNFPEIECRLN